MTLRCARESSDLQVKGRRDAARPQHVCAPGDQLGVGDPPGRGRPESGCLAAEWAGPLEERERDAGWPGGRRGRVLRLRSDRRGSGVSASAASNDALGRDHRGRADAHLHGRRGLRRPLWRLTTIACLLGAAIGTAHAQTADETTVTDQFEVDRRIESIATDRLTRNALIFLRSLEDPTVEDYQAVALTLSEAAALNPNDVELQRLILEAWYAAGETEKVIETTKKIIRLDPSDTVAQLRLISDRIRRYQNVEDRQAAYDRLLAGGADAFDSSILSRLAFDDALLARELGDEDRFIKRLTLATQLDATNKPAALVAATYTMERLDDPLARVEMLANVVLADPFDAATHAGLANELIVNGAFESARRFFQHATALKRMAGQPASNELYLRVLLATWAVDGAREILDILTETERLERFTIVKQKEAAHLAGEDPAEGPNYQPTPLNESLRLAASLSIGDRRETERALDRLKLITSSTIQAFDELRGQSDAQGNAYSADEIDAAIREWRTSIVWYRLWSGMELDAAERDMEALEIEVEAGFLRPEALQRFRGILAGQRGDRSTAEALLTPLTGDDPRAVVGLGLAAERAGDTHDAMRRYASIALNEPGTMLGIWCRSRIETLLGEPLTQSPVAKSLDDYCRNLPDEIDRMVREPRSMIHMEAKHTTRTLAPFDRLEVDVTIRNVGPIPVGIGPAAPISSDLLLSPRVTLGSNQVIEQIRPEIISMDRRLRLRPGETLRARIWAGQGQTGAVNDQALLTSALLRWRLVEGFALAQDGSYVPTPLSLTAESSILRRPPIELPPGGAIRIADWVRDTSGAELAKVMTIAPAAIQFVQEQVGDESAQQLIDLYADALVERLPSLSKYERAMVAQLLPSAVTTPAFAPVVEALQQDEDEFVQLTYLYVRASTVDDPVFDVCEASDNPALRMIAAQLQRRIAAITGQEEASVPSK